MLWVYTDRLFHFLFDGWQEAIKSQALLLSCVSMYLVVDGRELWLDHLHIDWQALCAA